MAIQFTRTSIARGRLCLPIMVMALMMAGLPYTSRGEPEQSASPSVGQLGVVNFPASGSERAHPHFLRGLAALHSFWYEEAINAFRRAAAIDPYFAMAYWGEAMAHNHPLWDEENLAAGRAALSKIPDDAPVTERERRYLQAVQVLFSEGSKSSRDQTYAAEMERLAGAFPDDREATCFYALSLLGLATHFNAEPDIQEKYRVQAGALTLGIYRLNPDHPCAAHYTIHAFDDPIHAILALPQARRYAEIAPEAHHAQHMPAHIFLQLGMWEKAAASNKAGWESSQAWVKREQLPLALQDYHSLHWLHYAYLQQGRYNAAVSVLLDKQRDMAQAQSEQQTDIPDYERNVSRQYDHMVAASIVETGRWEQAGQSWEVDGIRFGDQSPALADYIRSLAQHMQDLRKLAKGRQEKTFHPHGQNEQPVPIKQDEQFEQEQIEQEQIEQEQIEQDELLELDEQKVRNHLPEQEQIEQDDKPERSRDAATSPASAYSQIWDLQLAGLKHLLNGEQAQATELMDQAVALEDQLPPPSGPPDLVKPTRELYGELLLFIDRPKEAQQQFKRSLLWHPNRARSLLGLGRAAAQLDDLDSARDAYATLLYIWKQADEGLRELQEAKQFLQETAQP